MNQFLLLVIYIVELLNYSLGLLISFNVKRNWIWLDLVGLSLFSILIFNTKLQFNELRIIMYVIILTVIMITYKENIGNRILRTIMLLFLITLIESIFDMPISNIILLKDSIYTENIYFLCSSITTMGTLLFVRIIVKKRLVDYNKIMRCLRSWITILVILMAIFLLFTITGLNYAKNQINSEKFSIFISIVNIAALVSMGFIGVFIIYIKNTNEKMERLIEAERELMKMSINNYELLLEKEEDTRRYRHDLKNHLICLRDLIENNRIDLVNEYIINMNDQINTIEDKCYHTGNEILDAILNYYLYIIKDEAEIIINGFCSGNIMINNVDMCTIFSNLVHNAIEELDSNCFDEKHFIVNITQGKNYVEIQIRNSTIRKIKDYGILSFKSKKNDSRNHVLVYVM